MIHVNEPSRRGWRLTDSGRAPARLMGKYHGSSHISHFRFRGRLATLQRPAGRPQLLLARAFPRRLPARVALYARPRSGLAREARPSSDHLSPDPLSPHRLTPTDPALVIDPRVW